MAALPDHAMVLKMFGRKQLYEDVAHLDAETTRVA